MDLLGYIYFYGPIFLAYIFFKTRYIVTRFLSILLDIDTFFYSLFPTPVFTIFFTFLRCTEHARLKFILKNFSFEF